MSEDLGLAAAARAAQAVQRLDWADIAAQLDSEGHALLPGWLGADAARDLARRLMAGDTAREPLAAWRAAFYPRLAAVANRWNQTLGIPVRHPGTLAECLHGQREAGRAWGGSHLSRLVAGGHVPLHQGQAGEQAFPLQIVLLLSEPGVDFEGGEFVMTEQRPRMQSRPLVLPLGLGDAAIVARGVRPFQGTRGVYRVTLKHAIGRVRRGERIGLSVEFNAASDAETDAGPPAQKPSQGC